MFLSGYLERDDALGIAFYLRWHRLTRKICAFESFDC
jgi:hypothetical protein